MWGEDVARTCDEDSAWMSTPEVLGPTLDVLADLAGSGRALEFAVGTGRVALPLAARGIPVSGVELPVPMLDRLRAEEGAEALDLVEGDVARTRVDGEFTLVHLVFNTITSLLEQDEQVACFVNAARHLVPGGPSSSRCSSPTCSACRLGRPPGPSTSAPTTSGSTATTW